MKKMFCLFMVTGLMLTACGKEDTLVTKVAQDEIVEETMQDTEPSRTTDTDEPYDVLLTLPPGYLGKVTQDYLDKIAVQNHYLSITLNTDGSVTYIMTQSQHENMMDGVRNSISDSIEAILDGTTYPNFTDIVASDDYTVFTVTTKGESIDYTEQYSVKLLFGCGQMYNDYNGTPAENIHIDFVNEDSGEIIAFADSENS